MKQYFQKGQKFWHKEQELFVTIDDVQKTRQGFLYTLKCFQHQEDTSKQWKRYYQDKLIDQLLPLNPNEVVKVLYRD